MPKQPPYPEEFRRSAVELCRSSERPLSQIARELGVSEQSLRSWRKQFELDAGERRDGLTSEEREELRRLRRENTRASPGAGDLEKAAAFFARESETR